jgi:hypothetical protein
VVKRRWRARARPMPRDAGVTRAQAMVGQLTSMSVALEDGSGRDLLFRHFGQKGMETPLMSLASSTQQREVGG